MHGLVRLRPAQQRLLSILLLGREGKQSYDALVDRMWPVDPPVTAKNALQVHVAGIRRAIPGLITTASSGYGLDLTDVTYDLSEFVELAAAAQDPSLGWPDALSAADDALRLWRGPPFEALTSDDFALARTAMLDEIHLGLLERRAECLLSLGRAEEAMPELEMLVIEHPLRERLWEYLMLGRYRAGRRTDALRAYQDLELLLGHELGIQPGRRLQFLEDEILTHSVHLQEGPPATTPENLPRPANRFHGRSNDLAHVTRNLADGTNIAITGSPGVGKTRLAVEIARSQMHRFPDGVWIVELGGVQDSFEMGARIAAATSLSPDTHRLSDLAESLGSRQSLVILDAVDDLIEEVEAFLAHQSLISGTTRIVVTGTKPIVAPGVSLWHLAPFDVPDARSAEKAQTIDAVSMLMARVRSLWPEFRLGDDNVADVVELCRNAGGNPLAIELAARWLSTVGIERALGVGGSGVDDPLRAHLELSHHMTAASDRRALQAASVFAGAMSFDAFHHVAAPGASWTEAVGIVTRLVESSLLVPQRGWGDALRYTMPSQVMELAVEGLDGEYRRALGMRHAGWFISQADSESTTLRDVDAVMPDFRAALAVLLDVGDAAGAVTVISALRPYWEARYLTPEAVDWVDRALQHSLTDQSRLDMLWTGGRAAYHHHDYARARSWYEEGLSLAIASGNAMMEGRALLGLGRVEAPIDPKASAELVRSALQRFEGIAGAGPDRAACLMAVGASLAWLGDSESARSALLEALGSGEDAVDSTVRAVCLRYLSLCALYDNDPSESADLALAAEGTARRVGDSRALGGALIQRALVEATWGDPRIAASSILEALRPLPEHAQIDTALVAFGAVPALLEAGRSDVATDAFAYIDDVFERYGWMPITRRSPYAALLRSRALSGAPGEAGDGFRDRLAGTLNEIARR